jgi:hypothetical protein
MNLVTWVRLAAILLEIAPSTTVSAPTQPAQTGFSPWSIVIFVMTLGYGVASLMSIPATYACWIAFWKDRRYSPARRSLMTLGYLVLAILLTITVLGNELTERFSQGMFSNPIYLRKVIVVYLVLLIPASTYAYLVSIDCLVWGAKGVGRWVKNLRIAHDPLPKRLIRELLLKPIPMGEEQSWQLDTTSVDELRFFVKWADANREGTDKRLLPTAVFFGIVGVFADTQVFKDVFDGAYRVFIQGLGIIERNESPWITMGGSLIAAFALLWGIAFLVILFRLFSNLVVQSLVIEACLVAEYAHKQGDQSNRWASEAPHCDSFLGWLFNR